MLNLTAKGRLIFPLTALCGYLVGILFALFDPSDLLGLVPVLPSPDRLDALTLLFGRQILPFLAVWLFGFVRLPIPIRLPIPFLYAARQGYAALLILRQGFSLSVYFSHVAVSAFLLLLLLSLAVRSESFRREDRDADPRGYLVALLFHSGIALLLVAVALLIPLFC